MYVSGFSKLYPSCLYLCNQRGTFWVQMFPAVRTQCTTPLGPLMNIYFVKERCYVNYRPTLLCKAKRQSNTAVWLRTFQGEVWLDAT